MREEEEEEEEEEEDFAPSKCLTQIWVTKRWTVAPKYTYRRGHRRGPGVSWWGVGKNQGGRGRFETRR